MTGEGRYYITHGDWTQAAWLSLTDSSGEAMFMFQRDHKFSTA